MFSNKFWLAAPIIERKSFGKSFFFEVIALNKFLMPSGNLESKKNLSTNYGNKNGLKMLYLFLVSCLQIAHGPFPAIFAITFTNLPAIWKENVVNKLHSTKLKILSNLVQQQKTVTFVSARKNFVISSPNFVIIFKAELTQ